MSLTHLRRDSKKMSSKKPIIQGGSADLGTHPHFFKNVVPHPPVFDRCHGKLEPNKCLKVWGTSKKPGEKEKRQPLPKRIWVCLKIVYPYTQWFCWSLSLLNGYFIGNIPYFQTNHLNTQTDATLSAMPHPHLKPLFKPEEIHCNDPAPTSSNSTQSTSQFNA